MPTVTWNGVEDAYGAARMVGPRLRRLREARHLTLRELADRVGVSKNTILRIEHGLPIGEAILHRICDNLQTILPNLLVSEENWNRPFRVHRKENGQHRLCFTRPKAPARYKDFDVIEPSAERTRLGRLGFASGFLHNFDLPLAGGRMHSAIVELYGEQDRPGYRHSGEEFVYCLSGLLRLTVADDTVDLEPGDSAMFWAMNRHRLESALPADHPEVTRVLMVWTEDEEHELARRMDRECLVEKGINQN